MKKILTVTCVVIIMLASGMVNMAGAIDDVPTKNQPETSEPATMMIFLGFGLTAIASIGRKKLIKKKY